MKLKTAHLMAACLVLNVCGCVPTIPPRPLPPPFNPRNAGPQTVNVRATMQSGLPIVAMHRADYSGVSNALLDTPWPKLSKGRQRLQSLLDGPGLNAFEKHDLLAAVVSDHSVEADENLPNTGVEPELERRLSAQFICSQEYGTLATTSLG